MFIDSSYPTVLPPILGMLLGVALNIAAFVLAKRVAGHLPRFQWLPHIVASIWLVASPLLFTMLLLPKIPAEEAPGPGDGFMVLPVFLSSGCIVLGYCVAVLWRVLRALWNWIFPESATTGI